MYRVLLPSSANAGLLPGHAGTWFTYALCDTLAEAEAVAACHAGARVEVA